MNSDKKVLKLVAQAFADYAKYCPAELDWIGFEDIIDCESVCNSNINGECFIKYFTAVVEKEDRDARIF